ncbi:YgjV family protein [Patescibacteria group bacterium]
MDILFKTIGAIGLVLIIIGLLRKNERQQDIIFIIGGVCLEVYSIYLGDYIFIILQAAFIIAAIYEIIKIKNENKLS